MASYNTGSTAYDIKKWKDQLWLFMASRKSVKGLFKWQTLKQPKLAQFDRVLYEQFTVVCCEGNPVTWPMIIERTKLYEVLNTVDWATVLQPRML